MLVLNMSEYAHPEPDESTAYISENFDTAGSFAFEPGIVHDFDQHVRASIPLYEEMLRLVCELSDWFAPAGSTISDLGSGTGSIASDIARLHPTRDLTFHLYDAEGAMLEAARRKHKDLAGTFHYHAQRLEDDLCHNESQFTLALFVLQFLDVRERMRLLRRARAAAADTGVLVLAEKLRLDKGLWQDIAIGSLQDFKLAKGISAQAVRNKERALRGVLVPLTDVEQRRMLARAGWSEAEELFRWHEWTIYAAFASPGCSGV